MVSGTRPDNSAPPETYGPMDAGLGQLVTNKPPPHTRTAFLQWRYAVIYIF